MALDERLYRVLDRAARPADPSGIYEDLLRRRGRRQVVRRAQRGLLAVAVIMGSIAGVYGLTRVFETTDARIGVDPTPIPLMPQANGALVFTTGDRIVVADPDGSNPRELPAPQEGLAWHIAWSPDGSRLAVAIFEHPGRGRSLWVMNEDGSDPILITRADNVHRPSWHPDGEHLTYSAEEEGRTAIHVVRRDGSGDRVVYEEDAPGTYAVFSSTFSPDGSQIVFDAGTEMGFDIFLMDADGSNVRGLTDIGIDYNPAWSPDGNRIVFTRQEAADESDIFVMDADGSNVRRLTDDGSQFTNLNPQFSPDGSMITYTSDVGSIVVMSLDGSDPRVLIEGDVLGFSWEQLPVEVSSVSPSEPPTPTQSSSPGSTEDIGLGFPVCNVSSIEADFVVGGGTESVYVATRRGDVGGCPQPGEAFNVVALDMDGDGLADTSYGPIECELECRTFSAPDIDGDGTAELLVVQGGGSVVGLRLYDVAPDEPSPAIVLVTVAPPGDPEAGFEPGEEVRLLLGGDEWYLYTLRCWTPPAPDGQSLIVTAAESLPHDSPDAEWHAHQITFVLRDGMLEVVDIEDFTEPAGFDAPSFQSGETLCGSNLGP